MKKYLLGLLFILFMLFSANAEGGLVIEGITDGEIVAEDQYMDVVTRLNGQRVECEWSFSENSVARISSAKKLRIMEVREVTPLTITVHHAASGNTKQLHVMVVPNAKSIYILHDGSMVSNATLSVDLGSGNTVLPLEVKVRPDEAAYGVKWISSNESVARVSSLGEVQVIGKGTAAICASTADGKAAYVNIYGYYMANSITADAPAEMIVGETFALSCTVTPEIAAQDGVTYESLRENVISVDENGVLTANSAGTTVIRITASGGLYKDLYIEAYVPVTDVVIENTFTLKPGNSGRLQVTVLPREAKYAQVTFVSLNPDIATVDKYGFVTAVSPGKATIMAATANGINAHKSIVVVEVPVTNIAFTNNYISLKPGEYFHSATALTPQDTTMRTVIYTSDNESVATVDENGIVTAIREGRCVIYAQCENESVARAALRINVIEEGALPLQGVVIGIDPGHQENKTNERLPIAPGSDKTRSQGSYAIGRKTGNMEYALTLDIGLCLKEELTALGAQVVMTRTTNGEMINAVERAQLLNAAKVDIAIQLHTNAVDNASIRGISVYAKEYDRESKVIGQFILENACLTTGANMREVYRNNSDITLNWSTTPAVIVNCGHLSNRQDDLALAEAEYRKNLAKGIANGLVEYFCAPEIIP